MWRVLRRPRWLTYLFLAVVFGIVTAFLGSWQMDRHEQRVERRDVIETNYFGEPRPLAELLTPGEELAQGDQWSRVQVRGSYLAEDQHLVRNRPHQGVYGYQVLLPFRTDDGRVVAVDRGWVANAPTAAEVPDVPPPPLGEVEVVGWLRPSEPDLGRDSPAGQLASIDLPRLEAATGLDLAGGYVVLETEDPAAAARPAQLDPPDTGLGSHFAYALQWWLTIPVGLVLVLVMARRLTQEEAEDAADAEVVGEVDDDTGAEVDKKAGVGAAEKSGADADAAALAHVGAGAAGETRSRKPKRPPRPKKVRIWDEEDE